MASKLTSTVNDNTGDGGKVILTPKFIVLDDSTILAEAEEGKGGTIGIDAFGVYTFSPSTISAQSKSGEDGTVTISSPDIDIAQGLVILPATFLEADELLKPMCQYASDQKSSLTVRSYSGSPTLPIDWQGSHLLPSD
jgi:hypothetical protein